MGTTIEDYYLSFDKDGGRCFFSVTIGGEKWNVQGKGMTYRSFYFTNQKLYRE